MGSDAEKMGRTSRIQILEHMEEAMTEGFCTWMEDEQGIWHTDCRHMFVLHADSPSENNMRYCCYCGRELKELGYVEGAYAEEEEG